MRSRQEIEQDGKRTEMLLLEVFLDIREILKPAPLYVKEVKEIPKVKRKRRTKKQMEAARRK